uniref:Eukaryotic translation initiation factor 3 30 kDa subunit n=1 Tax=Dunaliella tertiolecta TaxID=3047 RepID=A0A7S3VSN1_DUNTE|mmetsp:Transcript_29078/g.78326  ORF Transcript_29078/g.78326 Transcript_29078/m.78326 type:complete len:231 (+) Transcript_29078:194-886(+)|eukprot:CAMPEP_0202345494 /NCGR_PEP_ID=MMETSP1126-20121109/4709_1 /ASSEMBLY_ACC=CAM_ASM_000457 /TAXON_ID=3047 /ORGANISM="Dunaliella tertiolecta, Strain CCMP1320" /LENGTH=230 /DNA_ID=CAMNT_0048936807 /DNA_START=2137 /DNA_END=2829 /DNA_ORIENTATION=+
MADNWEDDDWENAEIKLPSANQPTAATSSLAADVDMSKFADEERMLREAQREEPKHAKVESQPKKKEEKKYLKEVGPIDKPLDDPIAEKMRQQRLVEESDFLAAKDLFGGAGDELNLDRFLPKTMKEFEQFAAAIVNKYVTVHKDSKNYKGFIKALFKNTCASLSSSDIKDVETSVAGARTEKVKAEQAEAAASRNKNKKNINVGKAGDLTGGLDDYIYDDAGDADDDFM